MPIKPNNSDNSRSAELGASHVDHTHTHAATTGQTTDQHHAKAHAADHAENATDEILAEAVGTASTDVSTNLKPDGTGGVEFVDSDHADLANVTSDQHHAQAHTAASHSDQGATGAELEDLTDSGATTLHKHDHGGQDGLADDDHSQYLNESRHTDAHSSGRWKLGSSQTLSNNSQTTLLIDTLMHEDDADGDISFNTSTGILTINTTGVYQFTAGVVWTSNSTGFRELIIDNQGVEAICAQLQAAVSTTPMTTATLYKATATQTFRLRAKQNSGGNLDALASAVTFFSVIKL